MNFFHNNVFFYYKIQHLQKFISTTILKTNNQLVLFWHGQFIDQLIPINERSLTWVQNVPIPHFDRTISTLKIFWKFFIRSPWEIFLVSKSLFYACCFIFFLSNQILSEENTSVKYPFKTETINTMSTWSSKEPTWKIGRKLLRCHDVAL